LLYCWAYSNYLCAISSQSPLTASSAREAHEKFRFEISGHVANFLRPYRKESCTLGRITSDEDYKFLVNRVSCEHSFLAAHFLYLDSLSPNS